MSLVRVRTMYKEFFWAITEMQKEKELQHDLFDELNFHLDGGSYCDNDSPCTLYEIFILYALLTLPCL